jgi:hypothetical protein
MEDVFEVTASRSDNATPDRARPPSEDEAPLWRAALSRRELRHLSSTSRKSADRLAVETSDGLVVILHLIVRARRSAPAAATMTRLRHSDSRSAPTSF